MSGSGMHGSRKLVIVVMLAAIAVLVAAIGANAAVTWSPNRDLRNQNQPRFENSATVGDNSGSTYPGDNHVAVSNNGATNYLHAVGLSDGAQGAVDWNNSGTRPAKYPYFGTLVPYGGNDAPITNTAATTYWTGDCGVMRPHNLTDDFGKYAGAGTPTTLTGGTATLASSGVATFTSAALADMDYLEVGDRLQTNGFTPHVFNRSTILAAAVAGDLSPVPNAPYWVVTGRPAWNQVTAVPDTASPIAATATPAGVFTSSTGGVNQFQGAAIGQLIQVTGATPVGWNGYYRINAIGGTATEAIPSQFTAVAVAPTVMPGVAMTSGNVTRISDAAATATVRIHSGYVHNITAATWAGGTATYTTSTTHGLVVGETVNVTGMTPGGYQGANMTITAVPTTTTFNVAMAVNPGGAATAPFTGTATVNTATSSVSGVAQRGSDCARIVYARSTDGGATWDGGGNNIASPCAAGANCWSTNAFNVAAGPTNGGVKSVLSETHVYHPSVEAYGPYVYVSFMTSNGGEPTYLSELCANDPRVLYVRVNNNYGAANSWSAPVRLSTAAGQISNPTLTVDQANGNVLVGAVDANKGDILLWRSTDNGASFTQKAIGNTRYQSYNGFAPANTGAAYNKSNGCQNSPRGVNSRGSDGTGYGVFGSDWDKIGNFLKIGAYNNVVGAAWFTNSAQPAARTVTAASWAGGNVTFTTSAAHNFDNGETIEVRGMTPAGYNGFYTVGDGASEVSITGTSTWAADVATFNTTNTAGLVVGQEVTVTMGCDPAQPAPNNPCLPDPEGYNGTYTIASVNPGTNFTASYPCPSYCPGTAKAGTGTYRLNSTNGTRLTATTFTAPLAVNPGAATVFGTARAINNEGDRIIAKISSDGGVTWPMGGGGTSDFGKSCATAGACTMHLVKSGAGGNCEAFSCTQTGPLWSQNAYPFGQFTYSEALSKDVSVVAGPAASGTRVDFAWVSDGGEGPGNSIIPRGLYFREYQSSTTSWSPNRLVACSLGKPQGPNVIGTPSGGTTPVTGATSTGALVTFQAANAYTVGDIIHVQGVSNGFYNGQWTISARTAAQFQAVNVDGVAQPAGGTTGATAERVRTVAQGNNDPCLGKFAANNYLTFLRPAMDLYGTTGVGIVYGACPYSATGPLAPHRPCIGTGADPGEEILYKESGNSGAAWGSDWETTVAPPGTAASSYTRVATPECTYAMGTCGTVNDMWRQSYAPDLEFDKPGDSATGCAADPNGSPENTCVRYVFFSSHTAGANPAYDLSYITFLMKGTQT